VEPGRAQIARTAVALLVEHLSGAGHAPAAELVADFRLHVRESTGG
jgi:hypothetical protein